MGPHPLISIMTEGSAYINSIDFSDAHFVARAWVVVLSYLLMDYRYLYL